MGSPAAEGNGWRPHTPGTARYCEGSERERVGREGTVRSRWVLLTDDFPPADGGVASWSALAADALGARVLTRARSGLVGAEGVRGPSFARWGGVWALARSPLRGADAALATTWRMAVGVAPLCRARGVPLHVVWHGSDARDGSPMMTIGAMATRWAVSADLARRVPGGARVLPCPMPVGPMAPPRFDRWIMISRAVRGKGGERFLRVAAAAGARAEVVGDGPELGRWRSVAAAIGIEARFHGRLSREAVGAVLDGGGVAFLLAEARGDGSGEGLGLALLEAAARGVPAVGCRTGGVPEAVGPGLILEDPGDLARSVAAIRAWWTPARGAEARAWLEAAHGPARFRAVLEGGSVETS